MLAAAIFILVLGFACNADGNSSKLNSRKLRYVDDDNDHDYESYRRQMKRERFRDDFKFGLIDNTNLTVFPLVTVSFTGDIHDSLLSNTISMTFQNPYEEAFSDISFVFPIDPSAAIYDLHIKIGDREVSCAVEEKEKATNDYEEAKKKGHGVYRGNIDATQRDVYQIDIGNLPPGESALITLRYVAQLNLFTMSSYRLSIPVGIFERYAPVGFKDENPIQSVQIGASSVKHYSASSFPINIALHIQTYNTISSILSPSKSPFELEMIGSKSSDKKNKLQTFGIKSVLTSAIGDYVLILNFKEEVESSLFLQDVDDKNKSGKSSSVSMVSLMPTLWKNLKFSEDQAIEIFFVIDQSGSMSGKNIELARQTLSLSINGLPVRSSFNIVGFGSTYTPYFKELREFNDASKRDALEILRSLDANMGGTEILSPLKHIIEAYSRSKRPRYVFLITDGAVSNQNDVVDLVRRDNFQFATKYFTFGIGSGASRGLIEDTAKASGGAFEMIDDIDIHSSGKVGDKVLRQLTRVVDPALSNTMVHWKFSDVDVPVSRNHASVILQQSPFVIPAVFKDSRQNIFVEINKNASQVRDTLESSFFEGTLPSYLESDAVNANEAKAGVASNNVLNYKEILDNTYLASSASLQALAGRSFLRELEIKYDLATTQEEKSDIKSKAIEMSKNSGILSRFTSFIAVELRPQVDPLETTENRQSTYSRIYLSEAKAAVVAKVRLAHLPSAFPTNPTHAPTPRETASLPAASFRRNSVLGSARMKAAVEYEVERMTASNLFYAEEKIIEEDLRFAAKAEAEAEAELKRMRDPVSILSRILLNQSTDGSWQNIHEDCIDGILASGSTDEKKFFSSAPSDIDSVVLATIANHICIERKFANMKSTFELALRKSVRFISLKTGWFFANGKVDIVSHLPERVRNLFSNK